MEKIRLNDDWIRSQLTEEISFSEKVKYKLKWFLERLKSSGFLSNLFQIPPRPLALPLNLYYDLLKDIVRTRIKDEKKFFRYEKILESRGLSYVAANLKNIIDKLPDFQAFIYATDEFFRDHIDHQIRVAVLGNFLLSQQFKFGEDYSRLVDVISSNLTLTEDEVRKAWWITGLFHDTGIPVEKLARNFNEVIKSDLAVIYNNLNLEIHDIKDPRPDKDNNEPFFNILTTGFNISKQKKLKRSLGWGRTTKVDHGMASAMLLIKSIKKLATLEPSEITDNLENKYNLYLIAAQAIMLHNLYDNHNCVEIESDKNPLAYLLVCCDEMQDWGREVNYKERKFFDPKFKKVLLVPHCYLQLSDNLISLTTDFKNQEAKDACKFIFDKYVCEKKKNFKRLKNKSKMFPNISITLTDFVFDGEQLLGSPQRDISA